MSHLLLDNVLAWGFQVAAIAALGLVLPVVFRLAAPHVRLTYLRALLAACLALPLLQPWVPTAPAAAEALPLPAVDPVALVAGAADAVPPRPVPVPETSRRWPEERVLLTVYVAGVVGRLAWMGLGLASLARLRRRSAPLAGPLDAVEDAMLKVGVRADFRVSDRVVRPATFGLRRPVVLVPPGFAEFPPDQQEAVAIHELLHVRRRDWVRALGDSVVLSVCWFHPALWWLVEQIHLSVEQVVDREVVALSGRRKPYLEALLKLAAAGPAPLLQPASSFLKHGHLAERVALLVREVSMSRLRLAASSAAVLTTLVVSGMFVVQAWPLRGPAEPVPVADPLDARSVPLALSAAPTAELSQPMPSDQQTKPTVDPKLQAPRPGMPPPPRRRRHLRRPRRRPR